MVIGMVWFLERNAELMACEVRRADDGAWECELTQPKGDSRVLRFDHPTSFIDGYLQEQRELMHQGWRPRSIGSV